MDNIVKMAYNSQSYNSWEINTDGVFLNSIKEALLNDDIPQKGVDRIVINSLKILSNCPNPENPNKVSKTGIVIGRVQSGKTSNFLTLTSLAFDNNYNLVILIGGTKNNLVKQNSDRTREYFNNSVVILNTNQHKDILSSDKIEQFIENNKKIIIVALKTPEQLNFLRESLFKSSKLSNQPILIIDDEGDEASLNVKSSKGDMSSTYKSIMLLKGVLNRHTFISITATPQANLLIDTLDELSPDFGYLVEPGEGYCGLDIFHGENQKLTVGIEDTEKTILDEGIPDNFYDALSTYIVACAIKKISGDSKQNKTSMLVHPSSRKKDHEFVEEKISKIITNWRKIVSNRDDVSFQDLINKLEVGFVELQKTEDNLPNFQSIIDEIIFVIKNIGVHIINGDKVLGDADDFYDYNIYVGGNMLGRGITLKGLTVSYIVRKTKSKSNVDTVEQRARWFGYHSDYINLCRVYASKSILMDFINIRNHESDLWNTIENSNLSGIQFKNISRILTLSNDMNPTRRQVAKTKRFIFNAWSIQRSFQNNLEYSQSNKNIIDKFKNDNLTKLISKQYGDSKPHVILEDIKYDEIINKIIQNYIFPEDSELNKPILLKLKDIFESNEIEAFVDVIWIRDGKTSKHPVINNRISEYMSGRRPQDISKPVVYKGDRYFYIKENRMQLQFHYIENDETGSLSYAIAIYIPTEYSEKIAGLVIGENFTS